MIKVYIFNKSNNVSRFDIFKQFFSVLTLKHHEMIINVEESSFRRVVLTVSRLVGIKKIIR